MKVKLNITIDEDIKEWANKYADKKRTTVSHMINQYFFKLKQKEREKQQQNT